MELQRIARAVAERLHRKAVALGQEIGAVWQIETLAMPLIDLLGPRIAQRQPDIGRADRVVADLGMTVGVRIDSGADVLRQHLRAEADAEQRLLLP
jgi:hypothetical protein